MNIARGFSFRILSQLLLLITLTQARAQLPPTPVGWTLIADYGSERRGFELYGDTIYAGLPGGMTHFSTNAGTSWDSIVHPQGILIRRVPGSAVLLGVLRRDSCSCKAIIRSTDLGNSWDTIPVRHPHPDSALIYEPGELVFNPHDSLGITIEARYWKPGEPSSASRNLVFRTEDNGKSWFEWKLPMPHSPYGKRVIITPSAREGCTWHAFVTAWTESQDYGTYRTRDNGRTFELIRNSALFVGIGDSEELRSLAGGKYGYLHGFSHTTAFETSEVREDLVERFFPEKLPSDPVLGYYFGLDVDQWYEIYEFLFSDPHSSYLRFSEVLREPQTDKFLRGRSHVLFTQDDFKSGKLIWQDTNWVLSQIRLNQKDGSIWIKAWADSTFVLMRYGGQSGVMKQAHGPGAYLFPNPASVNLIVLSEGEPLGSVKIIDVLGRTIQEHTTNESRLRIDISDIPTGYYTLQTSAIEGRRTSFRILR
jgi:hypothetical protein